MFVISRGSRTLCGAPVSCLHQYNDTEENREVSARAQLLALSRWVVYLDRLSRGLIGPPRGSNTGGINFCWDGLIAEKY